MPQWKAELDHLQQQRVLHVQFLAESRGELRDRQPQSGDDRCHWKMVTGFLLERGVRERGNIVHSQLPGQQAKRETYPRKIRGSQADEDRSTERSQDEE
eukprot:1007497-Heterocapsa_arctica.AAC.1